jgi:hypothetical protein
MKGLQPDSVWAPLEPLSARETVNHTVRHSNWSHINDAWPSRAPAACPPLTRPVNPYRLEQRLPLTREHRILNLVMPPDFFTFTDLASFLYHSNGNRQRKSGIRSPHGFSAPPLARWA